MPENPSILRIPRINQKIKCIFGDVMDGKDLIASSKGLSPDQQRSFITQSIFQETDRLRVLLSNTI